VFRGAGGLSAAVQEVSGRRDADLAERNVELATVDVGCDNDFAALLKSRASWVHGAPPCKTFSRARRVDQFASAKCLRSEERPQGFGCEATEVANKLAMRMLEIAKGQIGRGDYFSIENPFSSLMWRLKPYMKLAGEKDVRFVRLHQCMVGSAHKKETGVLTNAPWIVDLLCDAEERPHHHVPLIGLVEDFREEIATRVFYTELAAEYPEGLCNLWASGFHEFDQQQQQELDKSGALESRALESSVVPATRESSVDLESGGAVDSRTLESSVVPATKVRRRPWRVRGAQADAVKNIVYDKASAVDSALALESSSGVDALTLAVDSPALESAGGMETSELQRGVPISSEKAADW
jgi:hypothetical protein